MGLDYWEEMDTGDWMYVFEEPVIARPWSWKDLLSLSFTSGVTSAKQTLSNKYPLATEDDSWFYQALRGTGDIVTDANNASMLMLGVGLGGVGVTAMSPAAAALYAQYGAAMGWKAAEFALWVSIMGPDKAGRFLNAVSARGRDVYRYGIGYYARNKVNIDALAKGVTSGLNTSSYVPDNRWGIIGWSIGNSINKRISP